MTMKKYTIAKLQQMRESEDHIEFRQGEQGNVSYNGGHKVKTKDIHNVLGDMLLHSGSTGRQEG